MTRYTFKNEEMSRINKNIKYKGVKYNFKLLQAENAKYVENANKMSIKPEYKLCDITGLPGDYKCPRTGLYYYDLDVYEQIKDMKIEVAHSYIAMRNIGKNIYSFQKDY